MNKLWLATLLGFSPLPVEAATYRLAFDGRLSIVDGPDNGDLVVGDSIAAQFAFDTDLATYATTLPLGGGTYTIYESPLDNFLVRVGAYAYSGPARATIYYINDVWGGDGVVFAVGGLPGGPFDSFLTNLQFRFNGQGDVLDEDGILNGLPYDQLTPDFFAGFVGDNTSTRIFGTLNVSAMAVPEPGAWLMLVLGFGLIGSAIRAKSRSTFSLSFADCRTVT